MNLINNLMPSNFNEEDFEKKKSKNKLYEEELQTWRFNDKVYAKIYFERIYVDSSFSSSSIIKADYKSIICKSKDYNLFRRKAESTHEYILEFYIDRDFEFNSVWENIYTTL